MRDEDGYALETENETLRLCNTELSNALNLAICNMKEAVDEIERLRQTNKLLSDLFHEAVALPQGQCPRPATAGDGMFNPHHRALNRR